MELEIDRGFRELLDDWLPLTYALNALSRSMGRDDLYPFVLPAPVVDKLGLYLVRVLADESPANAARSPSRSRC